MSLELAQPLETFCQLTLLPPRLQVVYSENYGFICSFFLYFWCDKFIISFSATAVLDQGNVIASSAAPVAVHIQPAKVAVERPTLPKTNIETRKTGRKLVRPRFVRAEKPQGDVEMSESTSHDADAQGTLTQPNQQSIRKRSASAASDLSEDLPVPGETNTDVDVPVLKKSKGSDSAQEAAEGQAAALSENIDRPQVTEEALDTVGDITQVSNEEVADMEKEEGEADEKFEEPKEPSVDTTIEVELQENKNNMVDEALDKPSETQMAADEESKNPAELDSQQLLLESESEKEEGELVPDVAADIEEGADMQNVVGSSEIGEVALSPVASPLRVDDEAVATPVVEGDNSPDAGNDKNDEGDVGEEIVTEGIDKSNDDGDQTAVEADQMPEAPLATSETASTSAAPPDDDVSKNTGGSSGAAAPEAEEVKQTSPVTGTLVNLQERARQRAMLRQAGVISSTTRGRGRPAIRGRGARGRSRGPNSEK